MVDAVINMVVERLLAIAKQKIQDEVDLARNWEKEAKTLASTLQNINDVLEDAEKKSVIDHHVKAWLENIEEVSYEMDDTLDELHTMRHGQEIEATQHVSGFWEKVSSFLHSLCPRLKHVENRSIAIKIKELNGRLESIAKEHEKQFNLLPNVSDHQVAKPLNSQEFKRVIATSYVEESKVKGRDDDKNNLVSKLLSVGSQEDHNHLKMISVVRVGGLGKTTLAQVVFNDSRVKEHFQPTTWICVSDPFDEIKIAKAILHSLGKSSETENLTRFQELLDCIESSISGKRFLLILDDVWKHDVEHQWEPLKISLSKGAPGSRILVTTRKRDVAEMMGTTQTYPLVLLSDPDCFALLSQASCLEAKENSTILEEIGKKIVKKCDGLPLAAKTLGGLLRRKDAPREWENVLKSEIWELKIAEVELFPHFYLSYNELSPAIKRCFSYCALFPKDSEIEIDTLIRMWMAQGFLSVENPQEMDQVGEMEQVGMEYFQDLAVGSFFQDINIRKSTCRMHDIVHDFAQFLTKTKCIIVDSFDKIGKEASCINVRHLALQAKKLEASTPAPMCSLEKLRSFLSEGNLSPHMVDTLKSIRVLRLYKSEWKELPPDIGDLIHLRYLDLQCNSFVKQLPRTLCNLYNLQTLDIRSSGVSTLPDEIYKLVNLRHLLLSKYIPIPQGFDKLICLKTLNYFDGKLGYLKNLEQLEGELHISIGTSSEESEGNEEEDLELIKNMKLTYLELCL